MGGRQRSFNMPSERATPIINNIINNFAAPAPEQALAPVANPQDKTPWCGKVEKIATAIIILIGSIISVIVIPLELHKPQTTNPAAVPTMKPSIVLTTKPTHVPTIKPSRVPITKPSPVPTMKPSPLPSAGPTEEPTREECLTVEEIIRSTSLLRKFEDLYEAATNVKGYYVDTDTWTVFAPTNKAMKSSGLAIDDISDISATNLLFLHAVKGQALIASDFNCDVGKKSLIEMASGINTRTFCSENIPYGQKGGGNASPARFVGDEIVGCNGVVYIIDQVLLPPSNVKWYSGLDLK